MSAANESMLLNFALCVLFLGLHRNNRLLALVRSLMGGSPSAGEGNQNEGSTISSASAAASLTYHCGRINTTCYLLQVVVSLIGIIGYTKGDTLVTPAAMLIMSLPATCMMHAYCMEWCLSSPGRQGGYGQYRSLTSQEPTDQTALRAIILIATPFAMLFWSGIATVGLFICATIRGDLPTSDAGIPSNAEDTARESLKVLQSVTLAWRAVICGAWVIGILHVVFNACHLYKLRGSSVESYDMPERPPQAPPDLAATDGLS